MRRGASLRGCLLLVLAAVATAQVPAASRFRMHILGNTASCLRCRPCPDYSWPAVPEMRGLGV